MNQYRDGKRKELKLSKREIRIYKFLKFQSISHIYFIYVFFLLEIKIKMCQIYTTLLISYSNVQCYITEFNIAQKLECYSSAGVISALILRLNKIRKATLKTLEITL